MADVESDSQHDRQNSLLTSEQRRYLHGKKDFNGKSEGYEYRFRGRIGERVGHGLRDLKLLVENRDRFDLLQVLMETEAINEGGQFKSKRKGWRTSGRDVHELLPSLVTFVMALASQFNYSPADWIRWFEQAYETINPGGFAHVTIEWSPYVPYTRARDYYNGEALSAAEIRALHHEGLVPEEDLPENFIQRGVRIERGYRLHSDR